MNVMEFWENQTNLLKCPRLMTLLQEIGAEDENKTIIFAETKRKVDSITRAMRRDG